MDLLRQLCTHEECDVDAILFEFRVSHSECHLDVDDEEEQALPTYVTPPVLPLVS